MKIKFFYGLILILTSLSLGAEPAESSLPRPKLVVGIVVDQMRWDYLYRYYDRYGDRGFKRLLKEGFTCENTQLNYLPAFTAVGPRCSVWGWGWGRCCSSPASTTASCAGWSGRAILSASSCSSRCSSVRP